MMWRWWCLMPNFRGYCRAEYWPREFSQRNTGVAYDHGMSSWILRGQAIESVEQVPCDIC